MDVVSKVKLKYFPSEYDPKPCVSSSWTTVLCEAGSASQFDIDDGTSNDIGVDGLENTNHIYREFLSSKLYSKEFLNIFVLPISPFSSIK